MLAYVAALCAGTGVLLLPAATTAPGSASLVEALFTSASALCLTGLNSVNTATHWTSVGHVVILVLTQLGGIGIMTFASLLGLSVARRMGLRSRLAAAGEARITDIGDVRTLVAGIVKATVVIQAIVALALFARIALAYESSPARAAWLAVFHAIGAFNNGGFSLHSDSLTRYATDAWVMLPICAAVILGGLGFPVLFQLRRHLRRPLHWSMNTRIVVLFTAILLILGAAGTLLAEWDNRATLGDLGPADKLLVAFTHSTMARSGGFNTVDTSQLEPSTWLLTDVLMFIGAGPAGTGGGIKVTTFAVLFFIISTEVRGERAVNVLGKRLPRSTHRQAISIALLAVAAVVTSTGILLSTTGLGLDQLLFEVISAFGTVGLSTGITGDLPDAAQVFLVVLMFIGRLGPITLATALVLRRRTRLYELPKERPIIG